MLGTTIMDAGSTKLQAYAVAPADGTTKVVLVNMEASTAVNATIDVGSAVTSAEGIYLRGTSLTSTTAVTLGEAPVTPSGTWSPQPPYTFTRADTTISVPLPAASAVLVTIH
jgi:hypothetical protein